VPSLPKDNFRMRNPFLYRGLTHQSRRSGSTESWESRWGVSLESRSVTLVTWREIHAKKGLLLLKTGLHLAYHLDPVQGPAGSRFRDILPLPKPVARFLHFGCSFSRGFRLSRQFSRRCACGGFVRCEQALRAEPVLEQVGPLVQRGIAFAQAAAVGAVREYMQLRWNAGLQ